MLKKRHNNSKEEKPVMDPGFTSLKRRRSSDLPRGGLLGLDLRSARDFLGRRVNIHLIDGSVIVNVLLTHLSRDERRRLLAYRVSRRVGGKAVQIPLEEVDSLEKVPKVFQPV